MSSCPKTGHHVVITCQGYSQEPWCPESRPYCPRQSPLSKFASALTPYLCPPWSFQSYQRSEPCPSVGVFLTPSFPFPCSRPPHCTLQSEIQEWVEVYFPQLHWKLEMEGSAEWCSPRWWLPQSPKGSSSGVWGRCLTPVRHPWVASAWSPRSLSHRDWDRGQASPRHCLGQNQSYSEDGVGRQPGVES